MQPQQPQTPPVFTPPTPGPVPPVAPPLLSPAGQPPPLQKPLTPPINSQPQPPLGPKKPHFVRMIGIVFGLSLTSMAITAYFMLFTGVSLETYESDAFTVQVPKGFERKEFDEGLLFREPGAINTASAIMATYSAYPTPLPQDQLDVVKESFKTSVESRIKDFAVATERLGNQKIEEIDFKGTKALRVTAKATRQGATEYTVKMIAVIEPTRTYVVGVAAHNTDPQVTNSIDAILNSFAVK